jgi:pimeloyl-ACP methyl ester carboxylesterase
MAERMFIDTSVGRLAVTITGKGTPAVLWHSLFVDERSWQRVTTALGEDRRLVVITGPGHGASTDHQRRYDLLQCAGAADEVLGALGIDVAVDWVGNAWGGHVGLRFATSYADRIRSLVTIGTPVQPLGTGTRLQMRMLLLANRLLGPQDFIVDGVVETMLAPATRASDAEAVALVRGSVVEADRRRLGNAVVSISLHREDLTALLHSIAVPTLMITGAQHGGWTPAQAATAVTRMPDARVAVVPDAAYLVPLEQPEAVVELVRDFWDSAVTETPGAQR